ncbi:hypothetical protein [Micromonospora costi]|uniref:Uncharacterized protein n=1 Tax=Micromonospora costi TaxID=1530042 RepID=A0A3B0A5I9_9ACTN|nr:hypothetical protein [Micromonospora costi]RKN55684.1 hypothetical protein D7193_13765 [Micromonospora costi]
MRAGDLLRQLDQRLLPPLTRAVARLGETSARSRVLTGTALASAAAVLLTAVWVGGDRAPVGDPTVGEVTRVGVVDGDSVPGYLRAAAADLAALPAGTPAPADGTYALVSLDSYLPPQRLATVLGDVSVSAVFGRVPLPGRQTEIVRIPALRVPDDVVAGMAALATRKDGEAADYRARAAATGDAELRQVYASGAEVAEAEAAAYRAGCACVYAAVVRAQPSALRAVASRRAVRAVDPAPEVRRLERTVFTPPLPEQRDVVRPPADTALPAPTTPAPGPTTGTPAGAGRTPATTPSTPAVGESSEPAPIVIPSSPAPERVTESASPPPAVATSPDTPGEAPAPSAGS